jgi:hypothetical protein
MDKCKPVLLILSLATNLEKPLMGGPNGGGVAMDSEVAGMHTSDSLQIKEDRNIQSISQLVVIILVLPVPHKLVPQFTLSHK